MFGEICKKVSVFLYLATYVLAIAAKVISQANARFYRYKRKS